MSSVAPSCELPQKRRKYIVLGVATITILFGAAHYLLETPGSASSPSSSLSSSLPSEASPSLPRPLRAEEIIRRSYMRTFGALSTDTLCSPDVDGRTCVGSLLSEAAQISSFPSKSNNATSPRAAKLFPWWFVTMLRDMTGKSPVHGNWHNLTILDPPMDFCTIEKIATTQWRNVQCYLNAGIGPEKRPRPCPLNKTTLALRRPDRVSRAVMLRDPLERLLSGYLSKCAHPLRRRIEGHCEPNSVFNDTDMTLQIRDDRKQMFAAYVDGFPLRWNAHFFPQSMYCGVLFRHVGDYDFVGRMGGEFYGSLRNLAEKLGRGNRLPDALEEVFHFSSELAAGHGHSNVGRETLAAKRVKAYFTAASVRRALEYFAVDYLMLGLEVPSWAHDIISEENEIFMK